MSRATAYGTRSAEQIAPLVLDRERDVALHAARRLSFLVHPRVLRLVREALQAVQDESVRSELENTAGLLANQLSE